MRTLPEFLDAYGESHQNSLNQVIHFICVPAIFFSIIAMLWVLPLGQWLGLEGAAAQWTNGATLFGALTGLVYLKLGLGTFALMVAWFALSVAGIFGLQAIGAPVLWSGVAIFVVSWVFQFYGHQVEGKKPSFLEDLIFLLIGPVFVSVEIAARMGLPVPYAMEQKD
ncbi:MAG: DUF962 domain-containing protein [Pseudomonadota bacterium]